MTESKTFSASEKGTLTHLILQKLDFQNPEFINNVDNTQALSQLLNEFINSLVNKSFITKEEANVINKNYLINFLQSIIGRKLQHAQIIEKEKPFCAQISLKDINPAEYGNDEENYILVQGIIDLFFKTQDGRWILLDYKTDYVPDNNEEYLVEKYKKQLEIYKKALEIYIDEKVSDVVIYSLYLGKDIHIEA
jgi:ATP-dependent helicase/nuclease subunit A